MRDKRDLYNGFGDTLARAFEMVAAPVLLGLVGRFLDVRLGWSPVLTIVFVVLALAGTVVRLFYAYDTTMKAQDTGAPWSRRP